MRAWSNACSTTSSATPRATAGPTARFASLHAGWIPADPQSVEIGVFNNGPVIPPEVGDNLFGKYARGTNGKRGFGLYFCRLACEAHNGRITYRGTSDGPTFFITLPGRS